MISVDKWMLFHDMISCRNYAACCRCGWLTEQCVHRTLICSRIILSSLEWIEGSVSVSDTWTVWLSGNVLVSISVIRGWF